MNINIRKYHPSDWSRVSEIFQEGINTKNATFETKPPGQSEWESKQISGCTFVAESGNEILGWASVSSVSAREVYRGVGEISIYVSLKHSGKGIGKMLMHKLIGSADENNVWTLQASIFPENTASIRLHLSSGFRVVGRREKIGKQNGIWKDTILFERRSKKIL
jgi:L-amino acid N-acyltransferase YncA